MIFYECEHIYILELSSMSVYFSIFLASTTTVYAVHGLRFVIKRWSSAVLSLLMSSWAVSPGHHVTW